MAIGSDALAPGRAPSPSASAPTPPTPPTFATGMCETALDAIRGMDDAMLKMRADLRDRRDELIRARDEITYALDAVCHQINEFDAVLPELPPAVPTRSR